MDRRADRSIGEVWSVSDLGELRIPAARLALGAPSRNPLQGEFKLGEQFIASNRASFDLFAVSGKLEPSQSGVNIVLSTRHEIGAFALLSPSTGRYDHGLVIRPRFGWRGVGALMVEVGAKVFPHIPRLPALPRSEHEVPRWVLAAIVLVRLELLIDDPMRKFREVRTVLDRPRGRIDWGEYVGRFVARNEPQRVPCVFSELGPDAPLLSTAHAAVLAQLQSLQRVKSDSFLISRLLARFEVVRQAVAMYPPSWAAIARSRTSLASGVHLDALEAMAWTHEERGLAGHSSFAGLPWRMSMSEVFEARVESVARLIARYCGGVVKTGRLRETQRALRWDPPYVGSQRTLVPDVEVIRGDETLIFDAKYKSHWEEFAAGGWRGADDITKEAHRHDLLQVLAYGASTSAQKITCVLVYPCTVETWVALLQSGRHFSRASVPAGDRSIALILAAIPFERSLAEIATAFASVFFEKATY